MSLSVIFTLFGTVVIIVTFFLFSMSDSTGLRAILLFFGIGCILNIVLRWLNYLFISIPEGHYKRFTFSASSLSGSLYYILYGQSIVGVALAWLFIIVGILGTFSALQRIWIETLLLQELHQSYKQEKFPNLLFPFAYVHAQPGVGVFHAQRLVAKLMNFLWNYQYLSMESGLSSYIGSKSSYNPRVWFWRYLWRHRQRGMLFFLVSDSLRRYPVEFRKWLSYNAAAFIVVHGLLSDDPINESFVEEAIAGCRFCTGPTFEIGGDFFKSDNPISISRSLDNIDQFVDNQFDGRVLDFLQIRRGRSKATIVAQLSERLTSTTLPIAASDSKMSTKDRITIQSICTYGIQPVANVYLRFRLAQSDVERFLSLLDCIDSLIRFSVITLIVIYWNNMDRDIDDKRSKQMLNERPLTLGSWVYLLSKLTDSTIPDELYEEISRFWKSEICPAQRQLVSKVNETELYSIRWKGTSQLDWLQWFTNLRNVTKGHGVVEETIIAPFWHPLHEIFLDMVLGLESLVLSSDIVTIKQSGEEVNLNGWLRGKRDSSIEGKYLIQENLGFLKLPINRILLLYPFTFVKDNSLYVFDQVRGNEIIFLDYNSGEYIYTSSAEFSEVDLYKIWSSKNHQIKARVS